MIVFYLFIFLFVYFSKTHIFIDNFKKYMTLFSRHDQIASPQYLPDQYDLLIIGYCSQKWPGCEALIFHGCACFVEPYFPPDDPFMLLDEGKLHSGKNKLPINLIKLSFNFLFFSTVEFALIQKLHCGVCSFFQDRYNLLNLSW